MKKNKNTKKKREEKAKDKGRNIRNGVAGVSGRVSGNKITRPRKEGSGEANG